VSGSICHQWLRHVHEVVKGGLCKQGAQSAVRIAAVINAAAQGVVSA
jgi:hypothetical protein